MKKLYFIIALLLTIIMSSCSKESTKIINPQDYNKYLDSKENKSLNFAQSEISFWQSKFDKAEGQFSYLSQISSNYSKLFEITANIDYLKKSEELLIKSNEASNYGNIETIRSLAKNYISQHRFKEALALANKALANGEGMLETQNLLFDIQMELGNYAEAKKALKAIYNMKSFDCLIRMAKWRDHLGDLKTAISLMKNAATIAEYNDTKELKISAYSYLADLSGRANKIKESYTYYLKTLNIDPNNIDALKGIAWIAFSQEKNTKEANRILNIISKKHNSPDLYLFKSEIANYQNDTKSRTKNLNSYFALLKNPNYGVMYNKYSALLFEDDKNTVVKALQIAQQEIANTPTPESYDLLAWTYLKLGENKKAFEIAQKYVANQSFNPKIKFHLASIYKANKMNDKIAPIKAELINCKFELGPNMISKINQL